MLTEIGRNLETEVPLKKIEERFCRQLKKEGLWENIHQQVLCDSCPYIKDDTLRILDLSDLFKEYAEKMGCLAKVGDGSNGGTIVNGYWTVQVICAELGKHEVLLLHQELFSQEAPGFKSENTQIVNTIDMVSGHTGDKGIRIIDRGGDRDVLYSHLLKGNSPKRFVIRLVGHRNLMYGNAEELALKLAYKCKMPYRDIIIKEESGKEKIYHISYGYVPVKLPGHDKQLYMLVVNGFGNKPMMLLTTEPLRRKRIVFTVCWVST